MRGSCLTPTAGTCRRAGRTWKEARDRKSDPITVMPAAMLAGPGREGKGRTYVHRSIEDLDHGSFLTSKFMPGKPIMSVLGMKPLRPMPETPAHKNFPNTEPIIDTAHRRSPQSKETYLSGKWLFIKYLNGVKDPLA